MTKATRKVAPDFSHQRKMIQRNAPHKQWPQYTHGPAVWSEWHENQRAEKERQRVRQIANTSGSIST